MIKTNSRYRTCKLYQTLGGTKYVSIRNIIDISATDDFIYTCKEGDRLDILAYKFYRDQYKWWVIADANDVEYPLDLEPGLKLVIPSPYKIEKLCL